jgi:hypothetical protein
MFGAINQFNFEGDNMPVIGARPTPLPQRAQTPILDAAYGLAGVGDGLFRLGVGSTIGRIPGAPEVLGLPGALFGGQLQLRNMHPYTWGLEATLKMSLFALKQITSGAPEVRDGDADSLGDVADDFKKGLGRVADRFATDARSKLGLG